MRPVLLLRLQIVCLGWFILFSTPAVAQSRPDSVWTEISSVEQVYNGTTYRVRVDIRGPGELWYGKMYFRKEAYKGKFAGYSPDHGWEYFQQGRYRKGKLHGRLIEAHSLSNIRKRLRPRSDKKHKPDHFIKHARYAGVFHYRRGQRHGRFRVWHETGFRSQKGRYHKGELHGHFIQWGNRPIRDRDVPKHRRSPANHKPQIHAHYKQGQQHGRFLIRDRWGAKLQSGKHQHGGQHGRWRDFKRIPASWPWYRERSWRTDRYGYRNGELHGRFSSRYANGHKRLTGRYLRGKLHGTYRKFAHHRVERDNNNFHNRTGKRGGLIARYDYHQGQKQGKFKVNSPDGRLVQKGTFFQDSLHGTIRMLGWPKVEKRARDLRRRVVSQTTYDNGQKHGPFFVRYGSGNMREEGVYFRGQVTAPYRIVDQSQNQTVRSERPDDFRSGEYSLWKRKRKVLTVSAETGTGNRIFTHFHANGEISETYREHHYLVHGKVEGRYPNGQIRYTGQCRWGGAHGTWKGYHANGQLRYEAVFECDSSEVFEVNGDSLSINNPYFGGHGKGYLTGKVSWFDKNGQPIPAKDKPLGSGAAEDRSAQPIRKAGVPLEFLK